METIENLEFEIECLGTERNDLLSYVVDLRDNVDTLTFKIEDLERDIRDSKNEIENLNQINADMQTHIDNIPR